MANEINLKYKVKAEILTPLSIGQGAEKDWVRGIDYIVKDGVSYHISLKKMVAAGIDANKVTALFASGNADGVSALIGNKIAEVSDMQFAWPCETENPIKTILRNELTGHAVLAGSSLKGAIRSILFSELRDSETKNEDVFGNMKDGTDFMRFVRVGDFEFEKTGLIATKIYNLHMDGRDWIGGWKHGANSTTTSYNPLGFNTIYESLLPGDVSYGNIMFAKALFERITVPQKHVKEKSEIMSSPVTTLCEKINDHTYVYLEKEFDFFQEFYQGGGSSKIVDAIDSLMDAINDCESNECIIKMSAGSGFHSITGDWQFDDYTSGTLDRKRNRDAKPKSRRIVISGSKAFSLMGFVKLTFE